ncbi:RBPJ-interacting and tubulin-associated protein 1-like [Pomacea canaliculata]|nr:RBPJ-interacting and tubulin-associated protein 1-like [Pomacea canaliculata]
MCRYSTPSITQGQPCQLRTDQLVKMADDFAVIGKKPPSVTEHCRPYTASSMNFGYVTKMPSSTVDETLFTSHHPSRLHASMAFPAPWHKKQDRERTVRRGPPLLWCPPNAEKEHKDMTKVSSSYEVSTIKGVPMKHQFRRLVHTPTFVDETLFGEPLAEPSFRAPWEGNKKAKKPLLWYPDQSKTRNAQKCGPLKTAFEDYHYASSSSSAFPVWRP